MLDADYITACERRARRFQGTFDQGTSGSLAADVMRLLRERTQLMQTLEAANETIRTAVIERMSSTPADDPKMVGYSAATGGDSEPSETYAEWKPTAFQSLRPGSREFLAVLEELRELHMRKTLDYGVDEDALSNIRSSADVVNMPAWAGCILRISDKMHRLKSYFRRGKVEFDGLSDTLRDIACYAVIAEVLRREEQG